MFFHSPSLFYFIVICNGVQSLYWSHHLHLAPSASGLHHLHLRRDTFHHLRHMGNHPYLTPLHLQPLQSIHRNAQSVHIQRSETFVNKQRFHIHPIEDKEDKPNAKARDTKKDSPPEREWTLRTSPIISRSTICKASVSGMRCSS